MKWTIRQLTALVLLLAVSAIFIPEIFCTAEAATEPAKTPFAEIQSINATGDENAAQLNIKLSSKVAYSTYKTGSPLRIVIDLSQTTPGTFTEPFIINKGNFKNLKVRRFDTDSGVITRILIEIESDANTSIMATPERADEFTIVVALPTNAKVNQAVTPPEEPKPALEASATIEKPVVTENGVTVVKLAETTNKKEKRILTAVETKSNILTLALEGGADGFSQMHLSNPERLVIDIPWAVSALSSRFIAINNIDGISSVRIGTYLEKLRIVVDLQESGLSDATVTGSEKGIDVKVKATQKKTLINNRQAAPYETVYQEQAPLPEPRSPNSNETKQHYKIANSSDALEKITSIEMIDFQVVEDISRISIKVNGDAEIEQPIKSPGFVTMVIKDVNLPKFLQRSIDTHSFNSPLLRITPVQTKNGGRTETKIRVAMRTPANYELHREADMIFLDFKHPENLNVEKQDNKAVEPQKQVSAKKKKKGSMPVTAQTTETPGLEEMVEAPSSHTSAYKGKKVTLEFADADVRKIFHLLAEVSSKNFVLGDDVSGTISIKLVNVPWDQALNIIIDTKGFEKREDGNVIVIKGKGKFKSQADEDQDMKKSLARSIDLSSETFTVNYADISSIAGQFTVLKSERGVISQDNRTNKVIVKDIPAALADMRKLLKELDVPEKQVMIEARIVEATSTFTRSLGVNWGLHYRDGSASFAGINSLDTGFGGLASTAPPTTGLTGDTGGTIGISFGALTSNLKLDLRLNAAASAGLIKIVSTPKVATLNNKTAKIIQGQQIAYLNSSSTTTGTTTQFVEAALALEVTPHINANGTISMKIDARNDSPGTAPAGSSGPAINKKQATTEMLLRDGETTVIGGIYVDNDSDQDDGVPFLMDIPLLGKLFKSNTKNKVKTELLIFITPRILNNI